MIYFNLRNGGTLRIDSLNHIQHALFVDFGLEFGRCRALGIEIDFGSLLLGDTNQRNLHMSDNVDFVERAQPLRTRC